MTVKQMAEVATQNTKVSLCAKNRGMKTIDYIDNEGMIETLEAIAMEVL